MIRNGLGKSYPESCSGYFWGSRTVRSRQGRRPPVHGRHVDARRTEEQEGGAGQCDKRRATRAALSYHGLLCLDSALRIILKIYFAYNFYICQIFYNQRKKKKNASI